jgi:hypothetical protein
MHHGEKREGGGRISNRKIKERKKEGLEKGEGR